MNVSTVLRWEKGQRGYAKRWRKSPSLIFQNKYGALPPNWSDFHVILVAMKLILATGKIILSTKARDLLSQATFKNHGAHSPKKLWGRHDKA